MNESKYNQTEDFIEKKKKNSNGLIIIVIAIILIISGVVILLFLPKENKKQNSVEINDKLKPLPLPEVTGGERGQLGIDKNINESNIDEFLNRSDSVYRDMRMLDDPASYENIGGDRFLSGYVKGFEVVPLPYLIPVTGLPEEVGKTYSGKTLFDIDEDGNYIPNYEESMKIIEELFPKDKVIFLMCGGGGYAGMTKNFLTSLGWDETKIYNVGGYWYYEGNNNIILEKNENGLDFSKVPYHEIKFEDLKEIERELKLPVYVDDKYYNNYNGQGIDKSSLFSLKDEYTAKAGTIYGEEIEKQVNDEIARFSNIINKMIDNKESFVLFVYPGDLCFSSTNEVSLETNIETLAYDNNFYYYKIGLLVYKNTELYKEIKYAPTLIVVYKGKVLTYYDAENNDHLKYNTSREEFNNWITSYIHVKK